MADWAPRPPDASYFGTGEGKWADWWLFVVLTQEHPMYTPIEEKACLYGVTVDEEADTLSGENVLGGTVTFPFSKVVSCQPIDDSDLPEAVEWTEFLEE